MPGDLRKLTIREGRPADVPLILQFIRSLAEYEKLSHECIATEDALTDELFGPKASAEVLLAFLDDEAVGFALYFHNFSTFTGRKGLYLEDLFVKPEFRGGGIGRALLRRLARIAVSRDCARFEWAVLDWNEPAIRFYETIGAIPQNDWTVYRLTGEPLRRLATEDDTTKSS